MTEEAKGMAVRKGRRPPNTASSLPITKSILGLCAATSTSMSEHWSPSSFQLVTMPFRRVASPDRMVEVGLLEPATKTSPAHLWIRSLTSASASSTTAMPPFSPA